MFYCDYDHNRLGHNVRTRVLQKCTQTPEAEQISQGTIFLVCKWAILGEFSQTKANLLEQLIIQSTQITTNLVANVILIFSGFLSIKNEL